jgi:beta-lactamase superfamily II metal-dependent hydrolase
MRSRGTRVRTPQQLCSKPVRTGAASIHVLAPCPAYDSTHDANDNSLVLRIDFGETSFLLMGDAELHEEHALVDSGARLRADVLKVGHHGSRTSSSPRLIAAVQPAVAVVSAGATNRFGHPHAEVVARLSQKAARVVELAKAGGTVAQSDGNRVEVTPYAGPTFYARGTQHDY